MKALPILSLSEFEQKAAIHYTDENEDTETVAYFVAVHDYNLLLNSKMVESHFVRPDCPQLEHYEMDDFMNVCDRSYKRDDGFTNEAEKRWWADHQEWESWVPLFAGEFEEDETVPLWIRDEWGYVLIDLSNDDWKVIDLIAHKYEIQFNSLSPLLPDDYEEIVKLKL